ncbi:exportin-5-like [Ambystoma mexicanum]|uniref:exportin-5-like n=1 Tax=Ambystoma mexicanum TaxID=8296 RepID=UPI0037E80C65
MSAEQVNALCEQLVKAVTVMMDPASTQRYRLEALRFCEEFKEKCPVCVFCGLKLAEKTQPAIVRHFGLQIMEHVVKFRWNNMSRNEKANLKNNVMTLISTGTEPILVEESHIKDVLARIVVEMIKREWPQHWPDMLMELDILSKQGETQSELVMFIMLRLAEDVVTFQTLPQQRRRDIQHTLTKNMEHIFSFMLSSLQESVNKYRRLKTDPAQESQAQSCCRVGIAALNTLAGYIDWVSMNHITDGNCKLLEMLCLLLNESELQVEAAECLLIAVNRKGKLEDRKPLMLLFGDVAMHYILSAAQTVDGEVLTEKRYIFLKRLCQILCSLGSQLCGLVGSDADVETPANFSKYLDSFLGFTTHSSQFLRSTTQITWGALFRHDVLSRDPLLLAMIPKYLRAAMTNLVKVGFPSRTDSPSCEYSRFDFDSDEDFNAFFTAFRAQQGEVMRMACRLDPKTGFQMAAEWLKYQLSAPVDTGPVNSNVLEGLCTTSSPSFIQWDAMTFFSESVISQIFRVMSNEDIPVNDGVELLQLVLNFEIKDPLILSCVLTNMSTLFPFVKYRNEYLPQVLAKLFAAVTFETIEESKAPRTRAVKNVRRHACSSIIKMCRDYSQLVLPNFETLYNHVKQLLCNELLLTQMEKCALMEALVLVSNEFKNYTQQSTFLEELMAPVASLWLSEEMQRVLSGPETFIPFVGVNLQLTDPVTEDPTGLNRSRISFCVFTILGVLRRARWPNDLEEAKAGGFVIGFMPNGNPIYRNPCTGQVLKLFANLLALIRTQHNLYRPEVVSRMGETFVKALDILEVEKTSILGLPQPVLDLYDTPIYKTVMERMQGFFCTLYDNCFHVLGHAGPAMKQDFYSVNELANQLLNSAFVNLENIPDYRLRPLLRVFVKPLVLSCPPEYHRTLVTPILGPLFSYLHVRLTQKWHIINQRNLLSEDSTADDNPESQEMLEEQLVRLLTREVIDLLIACCVSKKGTDNSAITAENEDDEMMATEAPPVPASTELTELGLCLMKEEEVCSALLVTTFTSLVWNDTIACQRTTTQLCWPLLKQMIAGTMMADAATWFLTIVLRGLQVHGQHDVCMAALVNLAFQIYDTLRPRFIELKIVMEQIPDIQIDSLEQFDAKLLIPPPVQKPADKRKKEHFKRLIAGCIGKPLGEQFRKEVHIKNLPSLFRKLKSVQELEVDQPLVSTEEDDGVLTNLFRP